MVRLRQFVDDVVVRLEGPSTANVRRMKAAARALVEAAPARKLTVSPKSVLLSSYEDGAK